MSDIVPQAGRAAVGFALPSQPYPGLRAFEKNEWQIFFGRERIAAEVIDRLVAKQFLAVHGDSGCGKSSLIRAGVMPRLERDHARNGTRWRTTTMLPRNAPLQNMAEALARLNLKGSDEDPAFSDVLEIRRMLNFGSAAGTELVKLLRRDEHDYFCLLVDQFEEIFSLTDNNSRGEAQQFVDLLTGFQKDASRGELPGLHVVLTMRSEFLGQCAGYDGLAETINETQFLLPRTDVDTLSRAIREPARLYGGIVNRDVAERLVFDAGRGQDQLPLLQHAMMLLQRDAVKGNAENWSIELADYENSRGISNLLTEHANGVVAAVVETATDAAVAMRFIKRVFKALTDINADGHAIRRPQRICDLMAVSETDQESLITALVPFCADGVSFLKIVGHKPYGENELVDISHEALIRKWNRLRAWTEEESEDGLVYQRLLDLTAKHQTDSTILLGVREAKDRERWWDVVRPTQAWADRYSDRHENISVFDVRALLDKSLDAQTQEYAFWREQMEISRTVWESENRDDALLQGHTLAQAKHWIEKRGDELTDADRAFIQESIRVQSRSDEVGDVVEALIQAVQNNDWEEARKVVDRSQITVGDLASRSIQTSTKSKAIDDLAHGIELKKIEKSAAAIRKAAGFDASGRRDLKLPINRKVAIAEANRLYEQLKEFGLPLSADFSRSVLDNLRSVNAHVPMARIGDRLISYGRKEPQILFRTAQGMLFSGQRTAALSLLQDLLGNTPMEHQTHRDALGLMGRAYQMIYNDAKKSAVASDEHSNFTAADALKRSIECFDTGYDENQPGKTSYHGINLVAVLKLAERDLIDAPIAKDADKVARDIINDMEPKAVVGRDPWAAATLGEAHLALGNWGEAAEWYAEYATGADAFALAGSIQQLEEVWGLGASTTESGQIIAGLKTKLGQLERGQITLSVNERMALQNTKSIGPQYEKVIKQDNRLVVDWFLLAIERCKAIARIDTTWGEPNDTGFLVRGGDFIESYGDRRLFLTNNHLISTLHGSVGLKPKQNKITFDGVGDEIGRTSFVCKKIVWQSIETELDATLMELHPSPDHLPYCPLAATAPIPGASHVTIVGQPEGKGLTVSLFDGRLLDHGQKNSHSSGYRFLRYQTPTEVGSSGSPVFDRDTWCIVGLHRSGPNANSGTLPALEGKTGAYEASEGVDIQSVREHVAAKFGGRVERKARADTGLLVEKIPRVMTFCVPELVEICISRTEAMLLFGDVAGDGMTLAQDTTIASAMNVQLTVPNGGITITPIKSQIQWINDNDDEGSQDASWQWRLYPTKHGTHDLQLIVSTQEVDDRGVTGEQIQVKQMLPVQVQANYRRAFWTLVRWGALVAAAGIVGYYAQKILSGLL